LKTISGLMKPASGTVQFEGKRIDGLSTHEICSRGIIQVPEGRKIFPRMKVVDNLEMGAYLPEAKKRFHETAEQVYALFPFLASRKKQLAATLSGGEQQMLALGRALMSRPRVLMLDEPSLGLSPKASQAIFQTIEKLNREQGLTILLVTQDVLQSLRLAHRAYVLENSRVAMEGKGTDLLNDPKVKQSFLGL
jgi:branched-chain amino acid transport system ATP-binding protein